MSPPPLDSNPIGTNISNTKISHLDLTTVGSETPDLQKLTLPTELTKHKEKAQKQYIPEDPESDPSLSDSLTSKTDSSDYNKYRK